jgi:hypothetical protein
MPAAGTDPATLFQLHTEGRHQGGFFVVVQDAQHRISEVLTSPSNLPKLKSQLHYWRT